MTKLLIKLFIKNNKAIKDPAVRLRYGNLAGITGIVTNFFLFLIKLSVGLISNSVAIIADAINNLTDSGSSLVTLVGFKISGKPADAEHPYGHGRMEYIAGLIVSFIILLLGFQLIQSSVKKIISPAPSEFSLITLAVLAVSVLIKLWQSIFYRKISKIIDSLTLFTTSADSRNDVLSTLAVLAAAIIARYTGVNLDGYMGAVVALFIMINGIKLITVTINPLLGLEPKKELINRIYKKVLSYDHIIGIHDLNVHSYGPNQCFASLHCEVPAEQDVMLSHDVIDNIERDFLREQGIHLVIHLDPVVTNDEKTTLLRLEIERLVYDISPQISIHDFRVVWSISHVNIIFDVVVPFGFKLSDKELVKTISNRISALNDTYNCVITVDHLSGGL